MGVQTPRLECDPETLRESSNLTKFQTRILETLCDAPKHGLGIEAALEPVFEETINHGRLYPNLDTLVEQGYIEKGSLDRRTNEYRLTDAGRALLAADYTYLTSCLEGEEAGTREEAGE